MEEKRLNGRYCQFSHSGKFKIDFRSHRGKIVFYENSTINHRIFRGNDRFYHDLSEKIAEEIDQQILNDLIKNS